MGISVDTINPSAATSSWDEPWSKVIGRSAMNKKLICTFMAFAIVAGVLSYWLIQNNSDEGFGVENKTVILQDNDNYATANTSSQFSPFVVAGLGLALVASVPIALKLLNNHSKKQLKTKEIV